MADYTKLTEDEIQKKIKGFELSVSRFEGKNEKLVAAAKAELKKLVDELEGRSGKKDDKASAQAAAEKAEAKKDVKKEDKKTAAKKPTEKKVEEKKDKKKPVAKKPTKKKVEAKKEDKKPAVKKEEKKKPIAKKPTEKKVEVKKEDKKPVVKKKKESPTAKFELTIDGKVYKFDDLKSKEECARATKAVQARYAEVKEHKQARKEGAAEARTIPVTRRITDGFVSVTKKAVTEAKKHDKPVAQVKNEIDALEKAFSNLFDKLEALMGKSIPKTQRESVMKILTGFETQVEKGESKKEKAKKAVKKVETKEDGGLASDSASSTDFDNDWSYASLM